jgi:hypothetical protein
MILLPITAGVLLAGATVAAYIRRYKRRKRIADRLYSYTIWREPRVFEQRPSRLVDVHARPMPPYEGMSMGEDID